MKIKTATLTGPALDWAVATCERRPYSVILDEIKGALPLLAPIFSPSTDWAQGGPIIEREGIRLHRSSTGDWWAGPESDPHRPVSGPTPLIAAMRCYVASKMGDTIDIPEELA